MAPNSVYCQHISTQRPHPTFAFGLLEGRELIVTSLRALEFRGNPLDTCCARRWQAVAGGGGREHAGAGEGRQGQAGLTGPKVTPLGVTISLDFVPT